MLYLLLAIAANSIFLCLGTMVLLSPIIYDRPYRISLSRFGYWASVYGLISFTALLFYIVWTIIELTTGHGVI